MFKIIKPKKLPLITLTTDFGSHSHFVAELKGKIAHIIPHCSVIDITHSISPFKLTETAFILKNSVFHFPPNTIHAVGVDCSLDVYKAVVIAKMNNQFIIAADNGIIPMAFADGKFEYRRIKETQSDYFSFKNSFPHYIKDLIESDFNLNKMSGSESDINNMVMQKPVYKENIITFNIIHLDAFGNAYTTLTRSFFEEIVGSKKFRICLSRFETVEKISKNYSDVSEGGKVCFFDENGYMVIAINRGRAEQLLGLKRDTSQLIVEILE